MADDSGNEDQWLYGDSNQEAPETEVGDEPKVETTEESTELPQQNDISAESEQVLTKSDF